MNEAMNAVTVQFTEEMKGYVTFGMTNFEDGYKSGREAGTFFMFHLTIRTEDIDAFVAASDHPATAEGWIECAALGGRRPVKRGSFNLLVDAASLNEKRMKYRLYFEGGDGRPLTMSGFKRVQSGASLGVWHDTTTLYTNILAGHVGAEEEPNAAILAAGIIHIQVADFLKELTTLRASGPTPIDRLRAMDRFGRLFLGSLWEVYGPSVMPRTDRFEREIPLYTTEGVRDAEITTHFFSTGDKLGLSLLRFCREPSDDVVVILHGLTTSSDMFIMPEHYNLVQYLLDYNWTDVWTLDFRMSNRFGYNLRRNRYTMDDVALYDIPAALATIRARIGLKRRIHVICHCLGSVSFMMALFGKTVDGVASVIANSVALTPRVPQWSNIKLRLAPFLCDYVLGIEYLNPWWRRENGWSPGQVLAWFVSLFHRECNVPACHMLSFMWGTGFPALYSHENLLDVTHRRGGDLYGGVSLNYYRHVLKMVRANNTAVKYATSDPRYAALPDNYFQYAADIETPVLFMTGEINNVFRDSNIVCHERLQKIAPGRHELHVFPRYGHQDVFMGGTVAHDIFPRLVEFMEKHRGGHPTLIRVPHGVSFSVADPPRVEATDRTAP
jgi:cholesterol oxidase